MVSIPHKEQLNCQDSLLRGSSSRLVREQHNDDSDRDLDPPISFEYDAKPIQRMHCVFVVFGHLKEG